MIRLENVTKRFGDLTAVNDLSLEVGKGEVCVLIGPSGCGKTTTLRMINRLIEPTSGRILVNGQDTSRMKPEGLRRSIGYAIQSVGLFPHMTVAANIAVVPELVHWETHRIHHRVEELLQIVGLDPDEHGPKYPAELSGGQAQRVGVARALAADPPILLMDEPFGAVDPLNRMKLQGQFLRIHKELKKTVILVTHDLDEAIRLADRIAIMESGKLVQYDTPENILARPVSKFVHDFVGTDRALKRLSRIGVKSFIKPAAAIKTGAPIEEANRIIGRGRSAWLVDDGGSLTGWVDGAILRHGQSVDQAAVKAPSADIAVTESATLKEALSRMLGLGFRSLPVVDDDGCLTGELSLADIEAATSDHERL